MGRPSTGIEMSELWRRVGVTLGALVIYRLGRHIPLPGVDLALLNQIFGAPRGVVDNFGEP
ncbi:MAG TPA: hypothetical protein VFK49_05915, partial [Stellaceae bacterium]|nr:hypothetical protein [Stellaceae bacterium]